MDIAKDSISELVIHPDDLDSHLESFCLEILENIPLEIPHSIIFRIINLFPISSKILKLLAPYFTDSIIQDIIERVSNIEDNDKRAEALAVLVSYVPPSMKNDILTTALVAARSIGDGDYRDLALTKLISNLSEIATSERDSLDSKFSASQFRSEILHEDSSPLPQELKNETPHEMLQIVLRIKNKEDRILALINLIPHLPKGRADRIIQNVLNETIEMHGSQDRDKLLSTIFTHFIANGYYLEALTASNEIYDTNEKIKCLSRVIPILPNQLKNKTVDMALQIAISSDSIHVLSNMFSYLPEMLLRQTLSKILQNVYNLNLDDQSDMLSKLLPRLAELGHPQEAIEKTKTIVFEYDRVRAIIGIATHLPEHMQCHLVSMVRTITDENEQVRALTGIAPYISDPIFRDALSMSRTLIHEDEKADLILGISEYLPESLIQEALEISSSISDTKYRMKALEYIALRMRKLPVDKLWVIFCQALRLLSIRTRMDLLTDLQALAPAITALGGKNKISKITNDIGNWWP